MTSTIEKETHETTHPSGSNRFGYVVAIVINAIALYCAHQLLDWEWPGFLTPEFDDLLPLVSLSFGASIVANAIFMFRDDAWVKSTANLITAGIAIVGSIATWIVFPFDFATYDNDWSWLARVIIVLAIIGSAIGFTVEAVKLLVRGLLK